MPRIIILYLIVAFLLMASSFSVEHKIIDLISKISYDQTEMSAKGNQYTWIKGNNLSLLFKASESGDELVTDQYEVKYVLKNYYTQKYIKAIDIIISQLVEFNNSRNPLEEQCKTMLGYSLAECKDYRTCYYACYYHPNCRFGLAHSVDITSTIVTGNETNTSTESVVLYGDAADTNDVVVASYHFSNKTKNIDEKVKSLIQRLSSYRTSYNFTFPREFEFNELLASVAEIQNNVLFNKSKLNYCKPIPYATEYIKSAIMALGTISDSRVDIDYLTAKTSHDTNFYIEILEAEKSEQSQKLFNITRKYDGIHQEGIAALEDATTRFRYEQYYNLIDTLKLSYEKLKNATDYETAVSIANDYELSFSKINDTIESGDEKIQTITVLRNSAVNSILNAKKDNYNAKAISEAVQTIDKVLEKDRISDADVNYITTTLDKIRTAPDVAEAEEIVIDFVPITMAVAGLVLLVIGIVVARLVMKRTANPVITAIVHQNENKGYETTLIIKMEKDGVALPDGTPVKLNVGPKAVVGETFIEGGFAHATLSFDSYPSDMDVKINAGDVDVAIKVHFVLATEEQVKNKESTTQIPKEDAKKEQKAPEKKPLPWESILGKKQEEQKKEPAAKPTEQKEKK